MQTFVAVGIGIGMKLADQGDIQAGFLFGFSDGGLKWGADITENPGVSDTEVWEIYNYTADAHPIHIHLVQFQILNRETDPGGVVRPPET